MKGNYFEKDGVSTGCTIAGKQNDTITATNSNWNFNWASWWIDTKKETEIKVKINKMGNNNTLVMGLSSSKTIQSSWAVGSGSEPNYTLCGSGRKYINGSAPNINWTNVFSNNAIVTIKIKNHKMNILVNSNTKWENELLDSSTKYRFAVGTASTGNSITILSVTGDDFGGDDEQKNNVKIQIFLFYK